MHFIKAQYNADAFPGQWCPEETASIWSKLFFSYVDSLLKTGYQKPLHQEDIWDLAARDGAAEVSAEFNDCLTSDPHRGSVVRAMWQNFGRPFLWAGVVKLVHDAVLFTGRRMMSV